MERTAISPADGAPPGGPYSPAIKHGNVLYVSGQVAVSPATKTKVTGGFEAEVRQVLDNLKTVIVAAGGNMASVLKVTVYLVDVADFAAMNEIYMAYFPEPRPARATVQAGLMGDFRVEIDAIAGLP
jgi:2-iminobutanoate/2-iminopropanoate deaminase